MIQQENRRYWPVLTTQCDFKALIADRDQLWAETMFLRDFAHGEQLYLTGEAKRQAEIIQELRRTDDYGDGIRQELIVWEEENTKAGTVIDSITTHDLLKGPLNAYPPNSQPVNTRIGQTMRELGYEREHKRNGNIWVKKR